MEAATQIDSTVHTASQEQGTTARLFPELVQATTPEGKVDTEPKKEIPAATTPTQPKYLDVQEFGDALIKAKVDGVELDVPFKDAVRAFQTDRYLTQKGQRIADAERRIKEKEQEILSKAKPITEPKIEEDGLYAELVKPHTEALSKQILSLSEEIKQMRENEKVIAAELAPVRYEKVMDSIDTQLKKEGLTDFKQKLPEIEKVMLAMPPERMADYDNPAGFEYLYKQMKLSELVRKENAPAPPPAKPKVVPIESSASPSNANTDGNEKIKEFNKAKKTGDWTDYMMRYG